MPVHVTIERNRIFNDRAAEITEIFAAAAQRHRDQLGTPPGSL